MLYNKYFVMYHIIKSSEERRLSIIDDVDYCLIRMQID